MESQHCEICNKLYNLGTREPQIMICCGNFICKACIGDLIRPQEQFFICPFEDCQQQNKSDSKMPQCKPLIKILEKNQSVNIYCADHLNTKADFYCKKHQTMICTNCAVQKHVVHKQTFVPLINQEFQTFCSLIQNKLKIENQRIVSMIENFTLFLDRDSIFSSEEFINLVKASKDIIAKQQFNREERKVLDLLGDKIFEEVKVDNQPMIVNQQKINNQPYITQQSSQDNQDKTSKPVFENKANQGTQSWFGQLFFDNKPKQGNQPIIVQPNNQYQAKTQYQQIVQPPKIDSQLIRPEDVPLITGWLGNPKKVAFQLIFRGTTNGFTGAAFHKQCDNQGPTITIVKSQHGKIFGGFCHLSWQSPGKYQQQPDEKAFIFSITHQTKHLQYQYQYMAVYHYSSYLATFGGGHDIYIADNCNQNQTSGSNFGCTYKPPNGITYQSEQAKQYLAGSRNFSVSEIETYRVVVN